ncbi:MAG: hypothetical protein H7334_04205 [Ferruginibacter sp.]|nr:hypothetical protein [Ferruginibacter sp.]
MAKKVSLLIMATFYVIAGINHFVHPLSYFVLIPPYFPFPDKINMVAGFGEILFACLLFLPETRKAGSFGIVVLLILFIPAHIYMIQKGGCMSLNLCVPVWVAWVRLFPLQFILIAWARWYAK